METFLLLAILALTGGDPGVTVDVESRGVDPEGVVALPISFLLQDDKEKKDDDKKEGEGKEKKGKKKDKKEGKEKKEKEDDDDKDEKKGKDKEKGNKDD
jgi:hypothetical protein